MASTSPPSSSSSPARPARRLRQVGHRHRAPPCGHGARRLDHRPRPRRRPRRGAKTHLLPVLIRIWPLPDDPPHAAGMGNLSRVKQWFDRHFDVADFLLAHGADINTTWSSHEPASILHELVFHGNYDAMRFLIDRGIDMTIKDYRWNSTAQGWARYAAKDEKMAQWLQDAERDRPFDNLSTTMASSSRDDVRDVPRHRISKGESGCRRSRLTKA
jgi:hypothetical protein